MAVLYNVLCSETVTRNCDESAHTFTNDGHGGTESQKNKKLESDQTVLTTRKRLPKRLIVLVQLKKWRDTTKKISGASRLTCASHFKIRFSVAG